MGLKRFDLTVRAHLTSDGAQPPRSASIPSAFWRFILRLLTAEARRRRGSDEVVQRMPVPFWVQRMKGDDE